MRLPSIIDDAAIRCRARSVPRVIAGCGSNCDGAAIAATSDRTLAKHVARPWTAGGIHADPDAFGATTMVRTRSSTSASARSVNAITRSALGCDGNDPAADGKPTAGTCFIVAPLGG